MLKHHEQNDRCETVENVPARGPDFTHRRDERASRLGLQKDRRNVLTLLRRSGIDHDEVWQLLAFQDVHLSGAILEFNAMQTSVHDLSVLYECEHRVMFSAVS